MLDCQYLGNQTEKKKKKKNNRHPFPLPQNRLKTHIKSDINKQGNRGKIKMIELMIGFLKEKVHKNLTRLRKKTVKPQIDNIRYKRYI